MCDMWHSEWLWNWFLSVSVSVIHSSITDTLYDKSNCLSEQFNKTHNVTPSCCVKGEVEVLHVRITLKGGAL
jgi:hypothetical protein